jgi:NADH dehydrogenase FAD-containing subunit
LESIIFHTFDTRHIEDKFANYASSKQKDDKDLAIIVGGAGFTGVVIYVQLIHFQFGKHNLSYL